MCYLQQANPRVSLAPPPLLGPVGRQGMYPAEEWQLDFMQMPPCKEYKYLLVYVDTFPAWIEASPYKTGRPLR